MTNSTKNSLIRRLTLGAAAVIVSTMAISGAAQAKSNFQLNLHLGNPGYSGFSGVTFGSGYFGPGYYGTSWNYCDKYLWKYEKTGKFKYKKKYMKCMGYW